MTLLIDIVFSFLVFVLKTEPSFAIPNLFSCSLRATYKLFMIKIDYM